MKEENSSLQAGDIVFIGKPNPNLSGLLVKHAASKVPSARISKLQGEHAALDQQLKQLLGSPTPNQVEITEIKKRKLAIKDELQRHGANTSQPLTVV